MNTFLLLICYKNNGVHYVYCLNDKFIKLKNL